MGRSALPEARGRGGRGRDQHGATRRRATRRPRRSASTRRSEGSTGRDDKVTVFELHEYGAFSDGGGRKDWKVRADEVMARWKASLPERIEVVRIPVVNQYRRGAKEKAAAERRRELHLRTMMTARASGVSKAQWTGASSKPSTATPTRSVTRELAKGWITGAGVSPAGIRA